MATGRDSILAVGALESGACNLPRTLEIVDMVGSCGDIVELRLRPRRKMTLVEPHGYNAYSTSNREGGCSTGTFRPEGPAPGQRGSATQGYLVVPAPNRLQLSYRAQVYDR